MDSSENQLNAVRFPGISGLIKARLKRRPLHSDGDAKVDDDEVKEGISKRTRSESDVAQVH